MAAVSQQNFGHTQGISLTSLCQIAFVASIRVVQGILDNINLDKTPKSYKDAMSKHLMLRNALMHIRMSTKALRIGIS
jgi:hypothetical protein